MPPTDRLDLVLRLTDLTTLELSDTPESVRALCARARRPDPDDATAPAVAAVCVYPHLVGVAVGALAGSAIAVASVAGAFPSGLAPVEVKVAEAQAALAAGATELDLTIDRQAFLNGRQDDVRAEVAAVRAISASARLKVILETGELSTLDTIRAAADLVLAAGADMVKTSTGKGPPGATPAVARVLFEAAVDHERRTGHPVGVKLSGGVRAVADAFAYLELAEEIGGTARLTPDLFRFGASALLDAVVEARRAR